MPFLVLQLNTWIEKSLRTTCLMGCMESILPTQMLQCTCVTDLFQLPQLATVKAFVLIFRHANIVLHSTTTHCQE